MLAFNIVSEKHKSLAIYIYKSPVPIGLLNLGLNLKASDRFCKLLSDTNDLWCLHAFTSRQCNKLDLM